NSPGNLRVYILQWEFFPGSLRLLCTIARRPDPIRFVHDLTAPRGCMGEDGGHLHRRVRIPPFCVSQLVTRSLKTALQPLLLYTSGMSRFFRYRIMCETARSEALEAAPGFGSVAAKPTARSRPRPHPPPILWSLKI
ncbi:hypothetical protein CAOG_09160, partial [Capsaspora owczarzaki ATCC 30864]|uniref:hypothetical protein n=1 Tax=Capsaspora owczarzaki (strain ATCC 30864) TaxID=595528 RepID=UPI00035227C3